MKITQLQISKFRNIVDSVTISPSPTINVFVGVNGSGKSSLLEAIFYLGYGRSFRTSKHSSVINVDAEQFSVFSKVENEDMQEFKLGLSRDKDGKFVCSINGERSHKLADLVSWLPVQIFTPQSTDSLLGAPSERRRFLDWGVFHVEHSFSNLSAHYGKLLRQRNALLKQNKLQHLDYWSTQLALVGEQVSKHRHDYVEALKPLFYDVCAKFLPEFSLEISYYRGWDKSLDMVDSLAKKQDSDLRLGHTTSGAHKADIRLKVNNMNAFEILSRGQLRMAVASLQLAQTKLYHQQTNKNSIFLLDDIGAELDLDKREKFIDGLFESGAQMFVTAIEENQLSFMQKYEELKMFHVEHGHVNEEYK